MEPGDETDTGSAVPPYGRRPAEPSDSDLVYGIKKAALGPYVEATWGWDEEAQREFHRRRFETEGTEIILAGGLPVGYLRIRRKPRELLLETIHLRPEWQGRGIGASIVGGLIEDSTTGGLPVRLWVLRVNTRAKSFYERLGFRTERTTSTHHVMRFRPSFPSGVSRHHPPHVE